MASLFSTKNVRFPVLCFSSPKIASYLKLSIFRIVFMKKQAGADEPASCLSRWIGDTHELARGIDMYLAAHTRRVPFSPTMLKTALLHVSMHLSGCLFHMKHLYFR